MDKPAEPRTCRYGHGPLQAESGYWGLVRVTHEKAASGDRLTGPDDNVYFVSRVAVCRTCGYVEFFNSAP